MPLSVYSPAELDRLAERPEKVLDMPQVEDPVRAQRMRNLAQYKGRSQEGRRKALANLPRRVKSTKESVLVSIPEGMTQPTVPAVSPLFTPLEKTFIGKSKKRVLSKEEYDLYVATWVAVLSEHPEYDNPSDHFDVNAICQETVNIYRIELWQHNNPGRSKLDEYNAATGRLDRARKNLADRRVDRVGSKANIKHNTNIAIMGGLVDPNKQIERQQRAQADMDEEMEFLNNTSQNALPNIADAQPEVTFEEVEGQVVNP